MLLNRWSGFRCARTALGWITRTSGTRAEPAWRYPGRDQPRSAPPHPIELAAKALARPALATDRLDAGCDLSDDRRWAVVDVARGRGRRADARFDRPHDFDDPLTFGDQGMHDVAGANLCRWLCRVAVDADVPAFAQLGRDGPSLDEAHRAQPAIDSCVVGLLRSVTSPRRQPRSPSSQARTGATCSSWRWPVKSTSTSGSSAHGATAVCRWAGTASRASIRRS